MAVTAGADYALCSKFTWPFENGLGNGLAVVTRHGFYAIPYDVMNHQSKAGKNYWVDTKATIGGKHPVEALRLFLDHPDTDVVKVNMQMTEWCQASNGGDIVPMHEFKRMRIFTGFIRRSVVLSKKDSGLIHGPSSVRSVRPKKDELQAWVDFFKDDPRLEFIK